MPQTLYCWRCKAVVPMLTDVEWETVIGAAPDVPADIWVNGASRVEIIGHQYGPVFAAFEKLTGVKTVDLGLVAHHRLSRYGPPCYARFCAARGAAS